jgi:hypothetical protein
MANAQGPIHHHHHQVDQQEIGADELRDGDTYQEVGTDPVRIQTRRTHGDTVLIWGETIDGSASRPIETSLDRDTVVVLLSQAGDGTQCAAAGEGPMLTYMVLLRRSVVCSLAVQAPSAEKAAERVNQGGFPLPKLDAWEPQKDWSCVVYGPDGEELLDWTR